jgi:glycerate kinase
MVVPERPVLVAHDSFKGRFRAAQVAGAIGRGLERAGLMPPDLLPLADGGDGPRSDVYYRHDHKVVIGAIFNG